MRAYGERQGRGLDEGQLGAAMTWAAPARDVSVPREIALRTLTAGGSVLCVWTGQRLHPATLDIDHCMPLVRLALRGSVEPAAVYRRPSCFG